MYNNKRITVALPAYNEEALIGKVLAAMPSFVDTVIVVDDGSTDSTVAIATSHNAIVVSHKKNSGVGASFQTGVRKALEVGSDIMVNIDADNQFNPADIVQLLDPIIEGRADFVTASRFKDRNYYPVMSKVKFYGNLFMSKFISKLTGQEFYDVSCGFRAFSKETLLKLNLYGKFTYTHETFLTLVFQDTHILEIPVKIRGTREIGKSKVASNVIAYGWRTSKIILRTYRDYMPLKLFSFVALFFMAIAMCTGGFTLYHFIGTGTFSPYKWVAFLSVATFGFSVLNVLAGFIMESLSNMRRNQEKILYFLKRASF